MRFTLLTIIFIFAIVHMPVASTSANETKKIVYINKVLDLFEVDEWIDYVRRVKNDEIIPSYYNFQEPNALEKKRLIAYDLAGFENGVNKQFNKLMTNSELMGSVDTLENPFIIKVLKRFDHIELDIQKVMEATASFAISERRKNLIESIYNLTSMQAIVDYEYKKYTLMVERFNKTREILKTNKKLIGNQAQIELLEENRFKEYMILSLATQLKKFKEVELAEFIRVLSKSKDAQKAIQIYKTFSYMYAQKFM